MPKLPDFMSPELAAACKRAKVTLRPEMNEDVPFALKAYMLSCDWEVQRSTMPLDEQFGFLYQQFTYQFDHYKKHYEGAEWLAIERVFDDR